MTAKTVCKKLARVFEGLSLMVYYCPAGKPTIGYGHVCHPKHPPIDVAWAEALLDQDVQKALTGAVKYCPVLLNHPEKLGAITDFCFNLGIGRLQTSTLRRKINQCDFEGAKKELRKWVNGGGRKLPGLVKRREAEIRFMG